MRVPVPVPDAAAVAYVHVHLYHPFAAAVIVAVIPVPSVPTAPAPDILKNAAWSLLSQPVPVARKATQVLPFAFAQKDVVYVVLVASVRLLT